MSALGKISSDERMATHPRPDTWLVPTKVAKDLGFLPPPEGSEVSVLLDSGEIYAGRIVRSFKDGVTLKLLGSGEVRRFFTEICAPLGPHDFVDRKQVIQRQRAGQPAATALDRIRLFETRSRQNFERHANRRARQRAERTADDDSAEFSE